MKTNDAIARFLTAKAARGLSQATIDDYRYRLGVFQRQYPTLPESPEPIEEFLAGITSSPENKDTYFRRLRHFYRWLLRRNLIAENPMEQIEKPFLPQKVAKSLSDAQFHQLFTHKHKESIFAFILLIADTAVRLGEAFSVDSPERFLDDLVLVSGKRGERFVPVSPDVRDIVIAALPWPWKDSHAAGIAVKQAFRDAGIDINRVAAHSLRHTFFRHWRGDETIAQAIGGWTSPRMLKTYRPFEVDRAVEQHRKYSPTRRITD